MIFKFADCYLIYIKWTPDYKTPRRKRVVNVFYFICKLNQDSWKPVVKYLKLLTVSVDEELLSVGCFRLLLSAFVTVLINNIKNNS